MLTPIEQVPNLVFDASRQQIIPVPIAPTQSLPPLAETPVPKTDTPSQQDYQSGKGNSSDLAFEQKEHAEAAQKLRAAWAYLQQLKAQVSQALSGGNAVYAKRIALEAADVAASIETISMQIPIGSVSNASTVQSVTWLPPDVNGGGSTMASTALPTVNTATASSDDSTSLVDLARQGLGTAKEVVDTASTLTYYSQPDRAAVDLSMRKVLEAMANVEAIAAKVSSSGGGSVRQSTAAHIDVNA